MPPPGAPSSAGCGRRASGLGGGARPSCREGVPPARGRCRRWPRLRPTHPPRQVHRLPADLDGAGRGLRCRAVATARVSFPPERGEVTAALDNGGQRLVRQHPVGPVLPPPKTGFTLRERSGQLAAGTRGCVVGDEHARGGGWWQWTAARAVALTGRHSRRWWAQQLAAGSSQGRRAAAAA